MLKLNDIRISKNFKLHEFESPDSQEVKMDPELLLRLQYLRDMVKVPVIITSGYRTKLHNERVSPDAPQSFHLYGKAADIIVKDLSKFNTFCACIIAGFRGIICYEYDKHTHVDVRAASFIRAPHEWIVKAKTQNPFISYGKLTETKLPSGKLFPG